METGSGYSFSNRAPAYAETVLFFVTEVDCGVFSSRLRMRRTSTKMSPVSVQIRQPNINQSGSIVSGPPPLIIMLFSLALTRTDPGGVPFP
jgi:hypothetical protein